MAERKSNIKLTKDTPYFALTGKLWGVYCEDFEENWLRYTKTVANILLPIKHNLFIIASVNFFTTGIVPWNLSNKIMKFLQKTHTTCYFRTHQGWTESPTTTVCCGWTSTIYLQYIQMSITLWACMTSHKGAFTLDTLRPEETMPLTVLSKVQNRQSPNGPPMVDGWVVRITFGWSVYVVVRNDNKTLIMTSMPFVFHDHQGLTSR